MPLHRLTSITMGVPDVAATAAYYEDFGLTPVAPVVPGATDVARFSTVDGGEQLAITHSSRRRLVELGVGVDDPDDLDRVARSLNRLELDVVRTASSVEAKDPGTQVRVRVEIAPHVESDPTPAPDYNTPGVITRENQRASSVLREGRVRPRKLGHVVLGSTNQEASQRFFTDGLGFKVSDTVDGLAAFMRCSTDHHNILVQSAPVDLLHHTSWQVDDVDEIGRGAAAMLEIDVNRHVWGLGRHAIGSNFFWYLKDPAGNFSEYYSDIDCIVDDALWTPGVWEGARSLYDWGPPPPPSFLAPEDLAALMTGSHSA
ncbi:VOC family protein [Aeromicrobium endophyticum]|uniref:Dioxygenase n=1 Tax=Aeromicrobium endophyticum TaxID=2292704 RepID=A0A371NYU3_9ACTN|nr:VOC family protein [Aeromicrobium endophyticum]REK68864.1 dioxygenase [Aeromicrobium endophyticum]